METKQQKEHRFRTVPGETTQQRQNRLRRERTANHQLNTQNSLQTRDMDSNSPNDGRLVATGRDGTRVQVSMAELRAMLQNHNHTNYQGNGSGGTQIGDGTPSNTDVSQMLHVAEAEGRALGSAFGAAFGIAFGSTNAAQQRHDPIMDMVSPNRLRQRQERLVPGSAPPFLLGGGSSRMAPAPQQLTTQRPRGSYGFSSSSVPPQQQQRRLAAPDSAHNRHLGSSSQCRLANEVQRDSTGVAMYSQLNYNVNVSPLASGRASRQGQPTSMALSERSSKNPNQVPHHDRSGTQSVAVHNPSPFAFEPRRFQSADVRSGFGRTHSDFAPIAARGSSSQPQAPFQSPHGRSAGTGFAPFGARGSPGSSPGPFGSSGLFGRSDSRFARMSAPSADANVPNVDGGDKLVRPTDDEDDGRKMFPKRAENGPSSMSSSQQGTPLRSGVSSHTIPPRQPFSTASGSPPQGFCYGSFGSFGSSQPNLVPSAFGGQISHNQARAPFQSTYGGANSGFAPFASQAPFQSAHGRSGGMGSSSPARHGRSDSQVARMPPKAPCADENDPKVSNIGKVKTVCDDDDDHDDRKMSAKPRYVPTLCVNTGSDESSLSDSPSDQSSDSSSEESSESGKGRFFFGASCHGHSN